MRGVAYAAAVAGCLAAAAPVSAAPVVFDVRDYGVKPDGVTLATDGIQAAIDAAMATGGGTVVFPAGSYRSGPIRLTSNLTLEIEAGATLQFVPEPALYPLVWGRYEGIETYTPSPLIGGENLRNVTIRGRGTILVDNGEWVAKTRAPDAAALWLLIKQRIERGETSTDEERRAAAAVLRPAVIQTRESQNIRIEGLRISGASFWTIHLLYCDDVVVRDVSIETHPGRNTDGIDVDSSRNVRITDSYLDTGDDAIVLKSGRDVDGRRVNRPTENVTITNCVIRRGHGAVVIGSEMSGGVRNVVASNIVSKGTDKGIRIKSGRGRGGVVENVRFSNWVIDRAGEAINVNSYYTNVPEEPVGERTPTFRDIVIDGITITDALSAVGVDGLPEHPIVGLRLRNVTGTAAVGLRARHTDGMSLENLDLRPREGPALDIKDGRNLLLANVGSSRPSASSPVVRLEGCPDVIVRDARAWPGTGTYLSVLPGESKRVVQIANHLAPAKTPIEEVREIRRGTTPKNPDDQPAGQQLRPPAGSPE